MNHGGGNSRLTRIADDMVRSVSRPLDLKALRRFGLIMGGMVAGLFGLLIPILSGRQFPVWPWVLAGLFFAFAFLRPESLRTVHMAWMRLATVLGTINARILLGIIYYLVVVPIGLVMRMCGKDPLARGFAAEKTTYRVVRDQSDSIERMERPF